MCEDGICFSRITINTISIAHEGASFSCIKGNGGKNGYVDLTSKQRELSFSQTTRSKSNHVIKSKINLILDKCSEKKKKKRFEKVVISR